MIEGDCAPARSDALEGSGIVPAVKDHVQRLPEFGLVGGGALSGISSRVILGLDPGICTASARAAEMGVRRASSLTNPFTGGPTQRIPGSSPRMTMGMGECLVMEPGA